jgi:hypothetical protein
MDVTGNNARGYVWKQPAWDIHWTENVGDEETKVNDRQVSYRNPMFFAMLRFYNKFMVSGAETTVKWDCRPSSMPLHNWTPWATSSISDPKYAKQESAAGDPYQGTMDPSVPAQDQVQNMENGTWGQTYKDQSAQHVTPGTNSVGLNATALQHPQTCPSDPSLCCAINRRMERNLQKGVEGPVYGFVPEHKADDHAIMSENVRGLAKREKFPRKYMKGKEMPVFADGKIVQLAKNRQNPVLVTKKYAPRELHKVPKALPLAKDPQERFVGTYGDADEERTIEGNVVPTAIKYADNQCLQYHIRESAQKDADTRMHSVSHLNPVMVTVKLKQYVFFYDRTKFSVDAHVSQGSGRQAPLKPALPIIRGASVSVGGDITNTVFAKDYTNERMIATTVDAP